MQTDNKPEGGQATSLSHRAFLQFAAAGSAATLPAVTRADAIRQIDDLHQLSDEEQLDARIAQLKAILKRMHPASECKGHYVRSAKDGSYRFSMQGDVQYADYDGDDFYELSIDGYLTVFILERDAHLRVSDGTPIAGREFYWATQYENGEIVDDRMITLPRIVRKMEGPQA